MRKAMVIFFSIYIANLSLLAVQFIYAASPNTISYQGRLRESGQPVSGTRNIQFKLFDASSAGTEVFNSGSQAVYVSSGVFGYQLGGQAFKDLSWATSSYWLEISVGGNAMSPREQINAMPYAFMASTAASLNGSGNIQITGAGPHYIANGNIGIGTANPAGWFQVGPGTFTILSNGNIGIGITNPPHKLSIAGASVTGLASQTNISAFVNNGIRISGSIADSSQDAIVYQAGGSGGGAAVAFGRGGGYNTFISLYTSPGSGSAGTITERVRIDDLGNVGIGTTNPTNTLDAYGNIVAKGGSGSGAGKYIGLFKANGSLPGYPTDSYPVLKTDYGILYFSAGGQYSAHMTAGGTWNASSSRTKKENFVEIEPQDILAKINHLPVLQWNYIDEDPSIKHIAPFAEDFHQLFNLNGPNDKVISSIDPAGIALVGIKALSTQVSTLEQQNLLLKIKNAELESRIKAIEDKLK